MHLGQGLGVGDFFGGTLKFSFTKQVRLILIWYKVLRATFYNTFEITRLHSCIKSCAMPRIPPAPNTTESSGRSRNQSLGVTHSFHHSPQAGNKHTQHFPAGFSKDSANFPLWERSGSALSTRSSVYLDALEINCWLFGFSGRRCWCWGGCWCWCCGRCWFLYVLLWCHFVLLKLESKGNPPPKKSLKTL